jgi:hypothetical protein
MRDYTSANAAFFNTIAPHQPFAMCVAIGSVGWKPDIGTGFVRELSDSPASTGSVVRGVPPRAHARDNA